MYLKKEKRSLYCQSGAFIAPAKPINCERQADNGHHVPNQFGFMMKMKIKSDDNDDNHYDTMRYVELHTMYCMCTQQMWPSLARF